MKILLTGANGQVGREILELSQKFQCEIFPFTRAELDITNPQQIETAVQSLRPDILINTAAFTAVDKAEQESEQAYAINRDAVENLAQVCKRYDVPLIHISTDYVFDGSKTSVYYEDDARAPLNVYGASKGEGEVVLQREWEKHVIVRTSWVFGKYGANFVKTVLRLALKQPELRIVQDQRGCPTPAKDLAQALLEIARQIKQGKASWGIFHYCGDEPTTWHEFARQIIQEGQDIFPFKLEKLNAIMSSEFPTPAKRPKNSILSTEKIDREYAIKPANWRKTLREVVNNIHEKGELREHIST